MNSLLLEVLPYAYLFVSINPSLYLYVQISLVEFGLALFWITKPSISLEDNSIAVWTLDNAFEAFFLLDSGICIDSFLFLYLD